MLEVPVLCIPELLQVCAHVGSHKIGKPHAGEQHEQFNEEQKAQPGSLLYLANSTI